METHSNPRLYDFLSFSEYRSQNSVHMGPELNYALKFLASPTEPETYTYKQIKKTLIDHFDMNKNKYAESIKFRCICQTKDDSISKFAVCLKQGAVHCEIGDFLHRMLVEKFLHRLDSRDTCDGIIAQKPEKFEKAYKIASQFETAQRRVNEVKISTNPTGSELQTNKLGLSKPKTKPYNLHNRPQSQGRFTSNSSGFGKQQPNKSNESHAKNDNCVGCNGQHPRRYCP